MGMDDWKWRLQTGFDKRMTLSDSCPGISTPPHVVLTCEGHVTALTKMMWTIGKLRKRARMGGPLLMTPWT
eukprot:1161859-Pelagomonas_calceolata.AAC.9